MTWAGSINLIDYWDEKHNVNKQRKTPNNRQENPNKKAQPRSQGFSQKNCQTHRVFQN